MTTPEPTATMSASSELPQPPRHPPLEPVPKRGGARRRALSRQQIVDAALAIVDADGLDALTMRSVAAALGAGAATLYAYVGSKDELLDLVIERVFGEVRVEIEPDPGRWMQQVKEVAWELRRVFASHGDLARASFGRIPAGENAVRGGEALLAVMRAGGLSGTVAAWALDTLATYVMGIAYEDGLIAMAGVDRTDFFGFIAEMRTYLSSLPPDRFPNSVTLAEELTSGDGDQRFEFGLEVLLHGLAAVSERGGAPSR